MPLHPTNEKPGSFSGFAILLSNGFAIILALAQDWDLRPMLMIYWWQSVIVGFFNGCRMLRLKSFSTTGLTSNGRPVPETSKGKRSTAWFFALHFGFFHLGYFIFISVISFSSGSDSIYSEAWQPGKWDFFWIASAILGFLCSHWFSYRQNVEADLDRRPNLGTMMFLPYLRIIPMHLTILIGMAMDSNRSALLLFLLLKTGADFLMHLAEHKILQKKKQ